VTATDNGDATTCRLERTYVDAKADLETWLRRRLDLVQVKIAEEIERARRVKEGINQELSGTLFEFFSFSSLSHARKRDSVTVELTPFIAQQTPTSRCRPSSCRRCRTSTRSTRRRRSA